MTLKKYLPAVLLLFLFITLKAQETKKDINSLSRNEVLEMTIEELSAYDLEEIMKLMDIVGASTIEELYEMLLNKDVTSASKTEESLFDSPLSTTVLSQNEIISSGATSIEEALRLVPGVIVREKTNGNYDVQIRGGQNMPMSNMLLYTENTTTLVMVDGRPVFNYGMGGILWETLPVSLGELDRIEVVRGPSSALYGPNAVNGVINLITKNPDAESPLVATNIQGGTQSTLIGDLTLNKSFSKKFSAGVSTYFETRKRNSDKIYALHDDEYIDLETYDKNNTTYKWSNDVADELFDDPKTAKNKLGINAFFNLNLNENVKFDVNAGYLDAEANTSTIGDNPTPYNIRTSYGYYTKLNGEIYGLNIQGSTNNVIQDFNKGHKGWTQATSQYNLNIDYLIDLNNLSIRPGVSYQSVYYDDRKYLENIGDGYFNDRVSLLNYAVSARFDYHPINNLRLVAALRSEKYNVPDKWMPSYQFIGSYKINKNNIFRAVYSRANQSTFMINAHSNYTWDRDGLNSPEFVKFSGNPDPDMMTMNMVEVGFRTRPSKNLLIDIEAFYNKSKDFSALMPDSTRLEIQASDPTIENAKIRLFTSHRSLDVTSKQMGLSISSDMVLSEKLILKSHFTIQKTTLDKFQNASRDFITMLQIADIIKKTATTPPSLNYSSNIQISPSEFVDDIENEATPNFWGSLAVTYKPIEKLSFTSQGYYYSSYFMQTQYETDLDRLALSSLKHTGNIDGKFLLNLKLNYKIMDGIDAYINCRNVLGTKTKEFIFMDDIGGIYLAGISIKL